MKRFLCVFLLCLFWAGCGSKPLPDWTYASFNHLEEFKKAYLEGKDTIADLHFKKALEEIKKSGDMNILARAYLIRFALHVAVLEAFDDGEYRTVASLFPDERHEHYYRFLKGDVDRVQERFLPKHYQDFVRALREGKPERVTQRISVMEDPLSQLIATGILITRQRYREEDLQIAIQAASSNGWKKALLIYLKQLKHLYEDRKENEKAFLVRERIRILEH